VRRREFITLLGGGATAWPVAARAQRRTMPVVGVLSPAGPEADANRMNAVRQGLKDTGYVDGENVTIEYRSSENQLDRLPAVAADLVGRQVDVIVTVATPASQAAKAKVREIRALLQKGRQG